MSKNLHWPANQVAESGGQFRWRALATQRTGQCIRIIYAAGFHNVDSLTAFGHPPSSLRNAGALLLVRGGHGYFTDTFTVNL